MAEKTWKLTDLDEGVYVDDITIGPADVGGAAAGYSIRKHTFRGGLRDGVDAVHVDNGTFSFVVLPTRGMGLWKAWLGDLPFGWNSPVRGPVHPNFVPIEEAGGLGWLDGFDELLVRCGLESNGAPDYDAAGHLRYPLHGRIANRPAHKVEVSVDGDSGEITVVGVVEETRFHFWKLRMTTTVKTKVGEPGLRIRDEVENFSGSTAGMQMLYHVNFGPPILGPGSKLHAPVKRLVPRTATAAAESAHWNEYGPGQPGYEERVYFFELLDGEDGRTAVLLTDPAAEKGVSLTFDKAALPCFTQWKNTTAAADGYVTGLEPGTNFPNPRSFETVQKRVVTLKPGAKQTFKLALNVHATAAEVDRMQQEIALLQGAIEPAVDTEPKDDWCAP